MVVPWWHLTDLSSPSVDGVSAPDAPLVCTRPGWSGLYLAGNITLTSVRLSETPSSETARRGEISGGQIQHYNTGPDQATNIQLVRNYI